MFCHKSFSFRVDCNKGRSASRRKLPPPVGATPLPPEATSLQCKVTTIIHFLPLRVYFFESNIPYTKKFEYFLENSGCVSIGTTTTGANSFTEENLIPARSIGPALFEGGAALSQLWLFIVAPMAGAALAALASRK